MRKDKDSDDVDDFDDGNDDDDFDDADDDDDLYEPVVYQKEKNETTEENKEDYE